MAAFLDTTIVVDCVLKPKTQQGVAAVAAMAAHQPCSIPWYAIKEFEAGAFANFIYTHNLLVNFDVAEALQHCDRLFGHNKAATARQAISTGMQEVNQLVSQIAQANQQITVLELQRRQVRAHLRYVVMRAQKASRALPASYVDPLECLKVNDTPAAVPATGMLKNIGPRCAGINMCAVARQVAGDKKTLRKIRDAIVAENHARPKPEHLRRLKTVISLINRPGQALTDRECRSLGDAVFAIRAPAGTIILTTNVKDHQPLAACLQKTATAP